MKKAILILACIGFWVHGLSAQNTSKSGLGEYKAKFSGSAKDRRLEIDLDKAGLTIEGYNGDELIITTDKSEAPPDRAKGLKSLYANGTDNTGLGLEIVAEGSTIKITKVNQRDSEYKIKVPKNITLVINEMSFFGGSDDFKISDIEGDIEIEAKNANIIIRNLNGSLVAHNTSGDIEVTFSKVNADKPTSITNISGEVDVTLPADIKANVTTKSISGEVYTDFDIALYKKGNKNEKLKWIGGGYEAKGTIGGGGIEMRLESISGNVYIRKK